MNTSPVKPEIKYSLIDFHVICQNKKLETYLNKKMLANAMIGGRSTLSLVDNAADTLSILKAGADPNFVDSNGLTALDHYIQNSDICMMEMLPRFLNEQTPSTKISMIAHLLSFGARDNLSADFNCVDRAVRHSEIGVAEFLIDYGFKPTEYCLYRLIEENDARIIAKVAAQLGLNEIQRVVGKFQNMQFIQDYVTPIMEQKILAAEIQNTNLSGHTHKL